MSIAFQLTERLVGFAAATVSGGEPAQVVYRQLVAPSEATLLLDRLERMQGVLFNLIPGLPYPSTIDHVVVIIRPDLSAVAYVNELQITAMIKPKRNLAAGEPVFAGDIEDISSINLGVEVPDDAAVVVLRSSGWRRSLFFDFGPLHEPPVHRDYPLDRALAEQALLLLGLVESGPNIGAPEDRTQLTRMQAGVAKLDELLATTCEDEARYQELLESNPWMLGGGYDQVVRHANLDDKRIPDFTGRRCYDLAHDVIEIKQPFLVLFRQDDGFAAPFNDAWNQSEKYLTFCHRQRAYLRDEKGLRFENPRCMLILGHGLTEEQRRAIREKEFLVPSITVWTYDELLRTARHLVELMKTAGQRVATGIGIQEP
jgi:Shedu protein SduA, C-terminal